MGVTHDFLTQYEEDGNGLLERIITSNENEIHFYEPERKSASVISKKRESLAEKNQKWVVRWVILTAFWGCHNFVYAEFGPNAHKEKQNVTQDTYFDSLKHLKNAIQSLETKIVPSKSRPDSWHCLSTYSAVDSDPAERFSLGTFDHVYLHP